MPPSILIVEDEATVRNPLVKLLRKDGFRVTTACNGREALERIQKQKPGLILLDMLLPDIDGWDFMETRRQSTELADIPVLIVTGLAVASEAWAKELGAEELFKKPVDPDQLREKVRALLGESRD